ncbi:MAG: MBL fold metallo-hydrolase [Candidatus Baltobacteraceae bacterium]
MRILLAAFWTAIALSSAAAHAANTSGLARSDIASSLSAMGGAAKLRALTTVEYNAVGTRMMVEQSERPRGPYFIDHFRIHEVRDLVRYRSRIDESHEGYAADKWWLQQTEPIASTTILNDDVAAALTDGKYTFAGGYLVQQNQEQFAFAPERVLLTAQAAGDLRAQPDVLLHGMRHHALAFTWRGAPCELFINAETSMPWAIRWTRPYPYQTFLNAWGDITTTLTYTSWSLEPYGISYPREWTFERVGLPDQQLAIVQLRLNAPVNDSALTVPAGMYAAHHGKLRRVSDVSLGLGGSGPPHEIAPGILEYPGGWNVAFVKQDDGVIVIEAPWSPNYTQRAFDEAKKRYGVPIKAVITTSDSWPHIAGVRQAVARDIPVYALDLNEPILRRLITAPHQMDPDLLAQHPLAAKFRFVRNDLEVGSGRNRLKIIPYRTATGERQMMVYFPEHQLLYTSDLFSGDGNGGWFTPQYLHEMTGAVEREHVAVKTIFGMHYDATPYASVVDYLKGFSHVQ